MSHDVGVWILAVHEHGQQLMLRNWSTPRTWRDANNRKEPLHSSERFGGAVAVVGSQVLGSGRTI